jgi:Skp family chaperone for outer membrane proteins
MEQTPNDQQSASKAVPHVAQASSKQPVRPGNNLLVICAVAAAFSGFSGVMSWHFATKKAAEIGMSAPVVLLDSARIAEKKIADAMVNSETNLQKAADEGKQFVDALDKTLAEYTAAGIVVVNSSVVVNRPGHLDITKDVAARLNVKLD